MKRVALINENGYVTNVILVNETESGELDFNPPGGEYMAVVEDEGLLVEAGWSYMEGSLMPPLPPGLSVEEANLNTLQERSIDSMTVNKTYIARSAPSDSQVKAQVKALSIQNNTLIRLILQKIDEVN